MVLQGVAVSPGYVRAASFLLSRLPEFDLTARSAVSPEETRALVSSGIAVIAQQLETRRQAYEDAGNVEMADLQQVQATMLEDPSFLDEIEAAIAGGAEAAAAVLTSGTALEQMLLSPPGLRTSGIFPFGSPVRSAPSPIPAWPAWKMTTSWSHSSCCLPC